jgi:hypothetical protein
MYRNFYNPLETKGFLEARISASHTEWWNFGMLFLKGNISLINSLVNPARSGTNKPLSQFPKNHYFYPVKLSPISLGPSFQYSNIPIGVKPLSS